MSFPAQMMIAGQPFRLTLRRHARTRRLTLRLGDDRQSLKIVAPPRLGTRQILDFVHAHESWITRQLARLPASPIIVSGAEIPVFGLPHTIISLPEKRRGVVEIAEQKILVPGDPAHLMRRVRDALIRQAGQTLREQSAQKAAILHRPVPPITLRDTKSRWGSCSSSGRLSYSWRLVMAPPDVLDYVVAHEVAHLVHLNHSPDFWALCRDLCHSEMTVARLGLKPHGNQLFGYL